MLAPRHRAAVAGDAAIEPGWDDFLTGAAAFANARAHLPT
jgi:hypothetical protein